LRITDFESVSSANSDTPACLLQISTLKTDHPVNQKDF
jgi:hypothetical protein